MNIFKKVYNFIFSNEEDDDNVFEEDLLALPPYLEEETHIEEEEEEEEKFTKIYINKDNTLKYFGIIKCSEVEYLLARLEGVKCIRVDKDTSEDEIKLMYLKSLRGFLRYLKNQHDFYCDRNAIRIIINEMDYKISRTESILESRRTYFF